LSIEAVVSRPWRDVFPVVLVGLWLRHNRDVSSLVIVELSDAHKFPVPDEVTEFVPVWERWAKDRARVPGAQYHRMAVMGRYDQFCVGSRDEVAINLKPAMCGESPEADNHMAMLAEGPLVGGLADCVRMWELRRAHGEIEFEVFCGVVGFFV
jgi:hypothetical protein